MKRNIRKSILRRSKAVCLAACIAGAALLSPPGAMSVKAASPLDDGELWIGNTQVTENNCADIFGNGTASYDPATMTLTLNGVHAVPTLHPQTLMVTTDNENNAHTERISGGQGI